RRHAGAGRHGDFRRAIETPKKLATDGHRFSQIPEIQKSDLSHLCFICVNLWLRIVERFENCSQDRHCGKFAIPMRLEPANIQQIGNELAIQWNDETESYLDLQFLRRACPCAVCGGEPDVLGNIMSRPGGMSYSDNSFELAGFDVVGGYAIQPRWADGHSTGIYSF